MSKSKEPQGRFFDDGDFSSEHDAQFLWILEHYVEVVNAAIEKSHPGWKATEKYSKIRGEPPLDGYPPVYPDAIVTGTLMADHRNLVPKLSDLRVENRYEGIAARMQISCSGKDCRSTGVLEFKFARFSDEWVPNRPDLMLLKRNLETAKEECKFTTGPNYYKDPYWEKLEKEHSDLKNLIATQFEEAREEAIAAWRKARHDSPPHLKDECFGPCFCAVIELKTKKEFFGNVLRQIKIYEDRIDNEKNRDKLGIGGRVLKLMILVTDDASFDAAFKSQGIFVFHIPAATGGPDGD